MVYAHRTGGRSYRLPVLKTLLTELPIDIAISMLTPGD